MRLPSAARVLMVHAPSWPWSAANSQLEGCRLRGETTFSLLNRILLFEIGVHRGWRTGRAGCVTDQGGRRSTTHFQPALLWELPVRHNSRVTIRCEGSNFRLPPRERSSCAGFILVRDACSLGSWKSRLTPIVDCSDRFSWCYLQLHVATFLRYQLNAMLGLPSLP